MRYAHNNVDTKKRPINVTIRADLIEQAKELDLNTSQAAEAGIAAAVKTARENLWREENKAWIDAHNERVARDGVLLRPRWMRSDGAL